MGKEDKGVIFSTSLLKQRGSFKYKFFVGWRKRKEKRLLHQLGKKRMLHLLFICLTKNLNKCNFNKQEKEDRGG